MSASLLSGGAAPSSVPVGVASFVPLVLADGVTPSPLGASSGSVSSSIVIQQVAGVAQPVADPAQVGYATAASTSTTSIWIGEPPNSTSFPLGVATPVPQGSFAFECPNASVLGGGAEGALTLFSYAGTAFNNLVLQVPKPSLVANAGDDICQLTGGSQAGLATFLVANPAAVPPVVANTTVVVQNISITDTTPIFLQPQGPANAGATAFTVTKTAGGGFTITADSAATGSDATVAWFIPRY
jgi:hypothetical protein